MSYVNYEWQKKDIIKKVGNKLKKGNKYQEAVSKLANPFINSEKYEN